MQVWLRLAWCLQGTVQAKPLDIWISSFQDQLYYESMVKLYKAKVDKAFEAKVQSFGFREMPEKLAVSIKTGINPPDVVQLDEVLFGAFLGGEVPFADLNARIKKAKLDKDIAKSRQSLFAYKGKTYGIPQSLSAMVVYYRADLVQGTGHRPGDVDDVGQVCRRRQDGCGGSRQVDDRARPDVLRHPAAAARQ